MALEYVQFIKDHTARNSILHQAAEETLSSENSGSSFCKGIGISNVEQTIEYEKMKFSENFDDELNIVPLKKLMDFSENESAKVNKICRRETAPQICSEIKAKYVKWLSQLQALTGPVYKNLLGLAALNSEISFLNGKKNQPYTFGVYLSVYFYSPRGKNQPLVNSSNSISAADLRKIRPFVPEFTKELDQLTEAANNFQKLYAVMREAVLKFCYKGKTPDETFPGPRCEL